MRVVLLVLFLCSLVAGEENPYLMSFEDLAKVQIVGATLTEKDLRSVPSAVTVFTQEEIKKLGLDNLQELMNFVPGFQAYKTANHSLGQAYSSRGRNVGTAGREVLVLVDGARTEDLFGGSSASTLSFYSLDRVKRVEFIRGPGSAIHGANSFLGVVNIITDKDLNEAEVQVSTDGAVDSYISASGLYEDMKLSAYFRRYYDKGENYRVEDPLSNNSISTSDPANIEELNLSLEYFDSSLDFSYAERHASEFYVVGVIDDDINEYRTE